MSLKTQTARLSIVSNCLLISMKLVIGFLSGSVSIISEAIHSFLDLIAAIIAFFSVKISDQPPDTKHPYGHGKFENVSGVVEALLIFIAAGWIMYEAFQRIMDPKPVSNLGLGVAVMIISGVVNIFVSRKLYKTARETDSIALEADALHLSTDVYTSFGVALGVLLMWITEIHILDPILAIIVALFILRESYDLFKRALSPLLDTRLSEEEIMSISSCIDIQLKSGMSYHQLRTRKSGSVRYIDFHLDIPGEMSVMQSHEICDTIEEEIKKRFDHAEVAIHVEPLGSEP